MLSFISLLKVSACSPLFFNLADMFSGYFMDNQKHTEMIFEYFQDGRKQILQRVFFPSLFIVCSSHQFIWNKTSIPKIDLLCIVNLIIQTII